MLFSCELYPPEWWLLLPYFYYFNYTQFTTFSQDNLSTCQFWQLRNHNLSAVLNVVSTPSTLLLVACCLFMIGLATVFETVQLLIVSPFKMDYCYIDWGRFGLILSCAAIFFVYTDCLCGLHNSHNSIQFSRKRLFWHLWPSRYQKEWAFNFFLCTLA